MLSFHTSCNLQGYDFTCFHVTVSVSVGLSVCRSVGVSVCRSVGLSVFRSACLLFLSFFPHSVFFLSCPLYSIYLVIPFCFVLAVQGFLLGCYSNCLRQSGLLVVSNMLHIATLASQPEFWDGLDQQTVARNIEYAEQLTRCMGEAYDCAILASSAPEVPEVSQVRSYQRGCWNIRCRERSCECSSRSQESIQNQP